MRTALNMVFTGLLAAMLVLSCSNPTGSEQSSVTSTLTVLVKDTAGYPIPGMQVKTFPETITLITNENGLVKYNEIEPNDYQVVASRSDIPIFYERIRVTNQPAIKLFEIALEVNVNLTVSHAGGLPLEGSGVSTSPPTINVIADQEGTALMERIPVKRYTFIITRGQATAYVYDTLIIARNGVVQDIDLVLEEQNPQVRVLSPARNHYQNIFEVKFTGEAFDFEDGELPPQSLVWSSDIDGYLGTGNELIVDRMSIGHHTITLTGHDSTQREDTHTTNVTLFFYEKDSYFPIPDGGNWTYANSPVAFDGYFDGIQGHFELGDVRVTMDDVNQRSTDMQVRFTSTDPSEEETYLISYKTTDYLDNDINQLFLTQTVEELSYQSEIDPYAYKHSIKIESEYRDKYPLLTDHLDASVGNDFTFETIADVIQTFPLSLGSTKYKEPTAVRSEMSFEGFETVTTSQGIFETVKLKIVQGDTERYWWLAKGYGLVQYSYNTMRSSYTQGPVITASLTDTNLDEMQQATSDGEETVTTRPAFDLSADIPVSDDPPPEELRQLMATFRGMLPY